MTSLQSPTIGTSAWRFLEISAGSMSAWIDLGVRREESQLAGHPVVEARAERDDQVAALQRADRGDGAVHAGHAQVLRVASGNAPRAISVVTTGMPVSSASSSSSADARALMHAAADVQHRALAPRRSAGPPRGSACRAPWSPGGSRAGRSSAARRTSPRLLRVLRDVHQHGAGPAGARRCGTPRRSRRGMSRRVCDQEVVLGDRHRDAADVGLLERVRADRALATCR